MPDGNKVDPRVTLKRQGDTLTGSSRFRSGPATPIQNGKINGDTVSWEVVREHDGRKVTTRYEGKLRDDTLKGSVSSDWAGETKTYPWEARRTPETPEGDWRWQTAFGDFRSSYTAALKLSGGKLTGKIKSRDREYDIRNGKFEAGTVSFTVSRERGGAEILTHYRGQLQGDTIKGQSETTFGSAEPRAADWLATRAED